MSALHGEIFIARDGVTVRRLVARGIDHVFGVLAVIVVVIGIEVGVVLDAHALVGEVEVDELQRYGVGTGTVVHRTVGGRQRAAVVARYERIEVASQRPICELAAHDSLFVVSIAHTGIEHRVVGARLSNRVHQLTTIVTIDQSPLSVVDKCLGCIAGINPFLLVAALWKKFLSIVIGQAGIERVAIVKITGSIEQHH